MARNRAKQITHFRRGGETFPSRSTACGRTIAGSMEISQLNPTCPKCAAFRALIHLEDKWTNGNPSDELRNEIDRLRKILAA